MKLLLVDTTVAGQSELARRIENIDRGEQDSLNLSVALASPEQALERVGDFDLAILGPELGDSGPSLVRQLKERKHDLEVIVFVHDDGYSSEIFRLAHGARARRVFVESSSNLDLLQELVGLHEEFCASGKLKKGRLIVVTQVKGGVGATTVAAALAEALAKTDGRTVVWDLDIETRDLSRGFAAASNSADYSSWLSRHRDVTRAELETACVPLDVGLTLLPPPRDLADGENLVGTEEGAACSLDMVSLLRYANANIVIDLAGRLGPQARALMGSADAVLCLYDDSALGLSGVQVFLEQIVIRPGSPRILMIGANTRASTAELLREIGCDSTLDSEAYNTPTFPFDPAAARWPGSGHSLYTIGKRRTVQVLEEIIHHIGERSNPKIIRLPQVPRPQTEEKRRPLASLLQRVAGRAFLSL